MRIKEFTIKRFRALRELTIEVSNMTVIIGENDCGKTSIMLALQIFFETNKLTDKADYFKKDSSQPIEIEISFCEIQDDFKDIDLEDSNLLVVKKTFTFEQTANIDVKTTKGWKKHPAKFMERLPDFVFVPVNRDLDDQGKMTTTSLFGKLFRPLIKQIVEGDGLQSAEELCGKIRFGIAKRITDLDETLKEQLNNSELKLDYDIEIDFLKGIAIPIELSDERVENIPIKNRGAGIQSSFILALFRVYAKYQTSNFILAIEEPENSLHPRAQREMRWAMEDFSKNSQVICTTHSPVFLDLGKLEDNIVLRRKKDGATVTSHFNLEDPNELRELIGIKISDSLLSGGGNCTLIVEGDTELYAYPHMFHSIGINSRSIGVSLISAGGSDLKKMKMHAKVLNAYDLPCIIVVDKNRAEDAQKIEAAKIPNVHKVFALQKGNFEEYLPLEIMVEVLNKLCEGDKISVFDIKKDKPIENQLKKLVHDNYPGSRFAHLKIPLGQEVGKLMVERGIKPDPEIIEILTAAQKIATA